MRICHVSPHLPPDQAANALLPAELGRAASKRGHSVTFVTVAPAQGRPIGDALAGPVRRIPARVPASALSRVLRIATLRRARTIIAALDDMASDADLLHLHSNGLIVEVAAEWARRRRRPFLLTLYGTEIWHYRKRWPIDPFTRAYRRADHVTFYSKGLAERARELGLSRPGMSVVYPTVSSQFKPADAATRAQWRSELGIGEPLVILNVKRLHELAGQRFLIDAFAQVLRERQDVRLIFCGTGPLRAALEEQTRALGISRQVTFAGLVANDTVARYAAVADVFALPSLLEALPTVAVEALAAGTPVVSADHPGGVELRAIFGDDVSVVPREDAAALSQALLALLQQPRRARPDTAILVREQFGPGAIEAAYERLYAAVVPA
jgi:glycosyltransferase involved in cell wall biosynthesis